MRTCTWCKNPVELVTNNGHLTCPECGSILVRRGDPRWDESWSKRIGMDEYWISYYYGKTPESLVQIEPLPIIPKISQEQKPE